MCTAATLKTRDFYFGRNLDYDFSYGEQVVILPRNYPLSFRHEGNARNNYAIIGMACVVEDYPLFYDGVNEKGLAIAGLNFVGNAAYSKVSNNKINVAQFEFIPYILRNYSSVKEVKEALKNLVITNTPFNEQFPPSQLHYIIGDKDETIVVEAMKDGIKVYNNPVGVLTNNPPFDKQLFNLNNYMSLSEKDPKNTAFSNVNLGTYSRGMGAIGLPGDLSSMSRFVKVAFTRNHSICKEDEESSVTQFFHILHSVEQQKGCCEVKPNEYEITIYSSCMNTQKGIYYYTTYDNNQINSINMNKVDLNGSSLYKYPLASKQNINEQN